jgi:hypothetical protein
MLDGFELPVMAGLHLQTKSPGHENLSILMFSIERINALLVAEKPTEQQLCSF